MLKLKKVAVTGGLSCGKSSVCRLFKELGAYVVNADEIVHQLLSPEAPIGQQVIKLIGPDIVVNRQIDRSKIAKKVFNDPKLLRSLEEILHPAVTDEIKKQYQQAQTQGSASLFVVEIPLLFETDLGQFNGQYDATIAVIADPAVCRRRFQESTRYDKDEFNKRMARQLSPEEKARRADFVIRNDGSFEDLRQAVIATYNILVSFETT